MTSAEAAGQTGTGLIGTTVGVLVFLLFLLFAAHVLLGLYTASVVSAAAYDAARTVAGADAGGGAQARDEAEARVRRSLGRLGGAVALRWQVGPESVVLSVRAPRPTLLPRALLARAGLADVERTVRVRTEAVR